MRGYVFGDTGGHFHQLQKGLTDIGVDVDQGVIPSDIHIIHIGDLIHKGPHSLEAVKLADRLIRGNPGQWTQIMGNHEAIHLGFSNPLRGCGHTNEDEYINLLQRMNDDGLIRLSYAFEGTNKGANVQGSFLATHAALTRGLWEKLGSPATPQAAVEVSHQAPPDVVGKVGVIYKTEPISMDAGMWWSIAMYEGYPSWNNSALPFHMIHGHTSLVNWENGGSWFHDEDNLQYIYAKTDRNYADNLTYYHQGDKVIIGCDPGYTGAIPHRDATRPAVFEDFHYIT